MSDSSRALARLAALAAPSTPDGAHLSPEELAAVRASDGDDPSLDEAYRHLASCAACRARLSEPGDAVRAIVGRAEAGHPERLPRASAVPKPSRFSATRVRSTKRSPASGWIGGFALAAGVLLTWLVVNERGSVPRATLLQRSYDGVMGDGAGPGAATGAGDRNVELTLQGESVEAASVLLVDADGHVVAPWLALRPSPAGLKGAFAPRTFGPHHGGLSALVVYGGVTAVGRTVAAFPARATSPSARTLDELRAGLDAEATKAGAGVMLERLRTP